MEENKKVDDVPYFIHEGMMARMAESNRRLLIALIGTMVALVASLTIHNNHHDDCCFS